MYCPVCSQEQVGIETRFCARCGFPLSGVSNLISNNGELPQFGGKSDPMVMSARKRGIKQGAVLMLSGMIIVPIIMLLAITSHSEPWFSMLVAIITFWGGILRMLYALLFESKDITAENQSVLPASVNRRFSSKKTKELPPAQSIPVSTYAPPVTDWRNTTNDLIAPPSVTDETTKFLTKNE